VKNVTLTKLLKKITFQPPKHVTSRKSQGQIPIQSLITFGSLVFELCCGQTDRQTNILKQTNRQRNKQTVSNVLPTPTDRVDVDNEGEHRRNLRGYGVTIPPTFWTRVYRTLTCQVEKMKNLLQSAANRCDLWKFNYNKIVFCRGSVPDSAGRTHSALPDPRLGPRVGWRGDTSPPLLPWDPRAPCSLSELVPPLLDQSYAAEGE